MRRATGRIACATHPRRSRDLAYALANAPSSPIPLNIVLPLFYTLQTGGLYSMKDALITYLTQRNESGSFLPGNDLDRVVAEAFPHSDWLLPRPYKIFFAEEALPPVLGFPVENSAALRELENRLLKWIVDEIQWQMAKDQSREKAQASFLNYSSALIKTVENAMLSNLLSDYHAVFWLSHSAALGRQFALIGRRVSAIDAQMGRSQGDLIKYKIYAKWSAEVKELMVRVAAKLRPTLEGEEERGLAFFKALQENVLILTEEFIGPDLRELRSFVVGYLKRDFNQFRDSFERYKSAASDLLRRDRVVRNATVMYGADPDQPPPVGLLLDRRFQKFLFEHPVIDAALTRDERENITSVARRMTEFAVLHQLRRGIAYMTTSADGDMSAVDRGEVVYNRSTRPIDFGRSGVVDPMVYRFGLMYDITSFSETLGEIARGGRKGEMNSYRQMLLFQRKLDTIAERHRLQFEKFLGDGAFYTTRRATRLIRAAVEIQHFYADMKSKGFAFNRGLRIALNYGYYRLLPMKGSPDSTDTVMEFYGPGVVELSRLTTGKATKEIEEIQGFLISHGYEPSKVQSFFAPLARGVDTVDHKQHEREFYAYVNMNGHLINEGIVASLGLLQELSEELQEEGSDLFRLSSGLGSYIGFVPGLEGIEYVGVRVIGMVSLKGLQKVEVGELVSFRRGEVQAEKIELRESLVMMLRQDFHDADRKGLSSREPQKVTTEAAVQHDLLICETDGMIGDERAVTMGSWDPVSEEIRDCLRVEGFELEHAVGFRPPLTVEVLQNNRGTIEEYYRRRCEQDRMLFVERLTLRRDPTAIAFLLGEIVEQL